MAETLRPRVLVVGGGMGGYVAAIRASQLGLDTVATPKPRSGRRGTRAVRSIDVDILLRDAAGRAAARHELQLDAEIPRAPPDRR